MPMRSLYHKSKKAMTASELEEAQKAQVVADKKAAAALAKKGKSAPKKEDK
jgi:hypothetical protein